LASEPLAPGLRDPQHRRLGEPQRIRVPKNEWHTDLDTRPSGSPKTPGISNPEGSSTPKAPKSHPAQHPDQNSLLDRTSAPSPRKAKRHEAPKSVEAAARSLNPQLHDPRHLQLRTRTPLLRRATTPSPETSDTSSRAFLRPLRTIKTAPELVASRAMDTSRPKTFGDRARDRPLTPSVRRPQVPRA
jgi:hypothetical protein